MSRKIAFALGGAFLGVVAVWGVIQLAAAGYAFGQSLAARDAAPVSSPAAAPASSSR
jgi:uncharacterized protein HemX